MDAVEHRLHDVCEGSSDGFRRQRNFEGADVAPVGARHLGAGGGEVCKLNQFVATRVAEEEAEPLGAFRSEDENVRGADAIERSDADLVEVRPQLTEEDFPFFECGLSTRNVSGVVPIAECDTTARHMFQGDVRRVRSDVVGLNAKPRVRADVTKFACCPALWNVTEL